LIERGGISCAGAFGRNERVDPGHLRLLTWWLYQILTMASIRNKRHWKTGAAFSAHSSAPHLTGFDDGRDAVIAQM
jgi:hypothetical protein